MPWIPRGLRNGIVTTSYPRRLDGYDTGFRGSIEVRDVGITAAVSAAADNCPTRAISFVNGEVQLDRGRCILCGRCADIAPEAFILSTNFATSTLQRRDLRIPVLDESDHHLTLVRDSLARRVKTLRRSVHVRHVDAGSDGADEWEIAALTNPVYDVQRLGIFFTASPRHADVLLVTGVVTSGMALPLRDTFDAMPDPKVVIAAGVEAISGGLLGEGYASSGGVEGTLPVDVFVPGSPATPFGLLQGILVAVNLLPPIRDGDAEQLITVRGRSRRGAR
jgi:Ni,Fe-hydrogenase III small subunit/ferredoxin